MSELWTALKPLAMALGPTIALRYSGTIYRMLFTKRDDIAIRPVPPSVAYAQNILFFAAVVFLASTLPYFAPENVYKSASIQYTFLPTDKLFETLQDVRPLFTPLDEVLRTKFGNKQCRLIYTVYGPEALQNCSFCRCDNPTSFFYYVATGILTPHLVNAVILGLASSQAGREGMRWRTYMTITTFLLAAADLFILWNFDIKANDKQLVSQVDFVHWRMRTFRFASLFVVDVGFSALLWATSTNRFLARPPSVSERLEDIQRGSDMLRQNLTNLIALRNTTMRDPGLRNSTVNYWSQEAQIMGEVMEEPEVIEGVNEALTRVPVDNVKKFAAATSGAVFQQLDILSQRRSA